jgi:glyoxylase-like metal-dependent hydrolase (beta-lactamase superfamily II)
MTTIKYFTFNTFQENTYIISNQNKECFIIDPGCSNAQENCVLANYISENNLKPNMLLNTHCHIDHIMGNKFVADTYGLKLHAHQQEIPVLERGDDISQMYGVPYITSPNIDTFLDEKNTLNLGDVIFSIIHAPGHSPGSICFYNEAEKYLIGGDVLFYNSIGRTDLPLGDHTTLINSIKQKLFLLPDDVTVYSGHGQKTNIGFEKKTNPFLQ